MTLKLKIKITTPKGNAKGTEKLLRPFILGFRTPHKVTTNNDDNEIIWEIEGDAKTYVRVQKNVFYFDKMMKGVLDNRMVKKAIRQKLKKEQQEDLTDMLFNQTKIELIH